MTTYVVLLRGVNVGKAKRVPMADLKQMLLEIGCTRATTLLNSGNAVVEHAKTPPANLARKLSDALAARFGFAVPVIVKSSAEFEAVVKGLGFAVQEDSHPKLLVAFAPSAEAMASLEPLAALVSPSERFHVRPQAAYLYCASGILESQAAAALLGKVGQAVTTRNWATVLKLSALARQCAA